MKAMRRTMRGIVTTGLVMGLFSLPALSMADRDLDPGTEAQIQKAMRDHIVASQMDGGYVIYDALGGGFKHLTFKQVHPGVVQMSGFYVSCIDFVDEGGLLYDIDFMVAKGDHGYRVYRDLIHAVDGKVRSFHRERATG
jgi:hypothetical protein